MKKLYLTPTIKWEVIDEEGNTYGIGNTMDEAVDKARQNTDDTIYTNKECKDIYDNISLADRQAEEMENQIRDTLPDDDYFNMWD